MLMMAKMSGMLNGGSEVVPLTISDVFKTDIFNGSGSALTVNNGIDLLGRGGIVWGKRRDGAADHVIARTLRGAAIDISPNLTNAEQTTGNMSAFLSSGFRAEGGGAFNSSGQTHVSWTIAQGAGFFSDQQIAHTNGVATVIDLSALGIVGLAFIKRTDSTGNWIAFHRSLTAGQAMILNGTNAAFSEGNYTLGSTSVTIGSGVATGSYGIMAWAHDTTVAGLAQCGSFVTDGSGNGSYATGWANGAQFAMIKCSSTTGDWEMLDTVRTPSFSSNDARLRANLSNAEDSVTRVSQSAGILSFSGLSASQTYIITTIPAP